MHSSVHLVGRTSCCRPAIDRSELDPNFSEAGLSELLIEVPVIAAGCDPDESGDQAGRDDADTVQQGIADGVLWEHADTV